jgi:hypothetical protein
MTNGLAEELQSRIRDSQPNWIDIEHVGISPALNHALYHIMVWRDEDQNLHSRTTILDGAWDSESRSLMDWVVANRNSRILIK